MRSIFQNRPFYVILLPLYFIWHSYHQFDGLVRSSDAIRLLLIYWLAVFILLGFFLLLYRHLGRAAFATFCILFIQCYFGPIKDFLKVYIPGHFADRYIFLLPALIIFLVLFIRYLKIKKPALTQVTLYANSFLILLLLLETSILIFTSISKKSEKSLHLEGLSTYTSTAKPDIWLIVTDEYAGRKTLDSFFHFKNSEFISSLGDRGFYLPEHNFSNYNFTYFSIPSMMNMDYISGIEGSNSSRKDMIRCQEIFKSNRLTQWLEKTGYSFYNYSLFDYKGQPSPVHGGQVTRSARLISAQTLLTRVYKDLGYHLITNLHFTGFLKTGSFNDLRNNEKIIALTKSNILSRPGSPRFVLTHLLMPHYPYYYDKFGHSFNWQEFESSRTDTAKYLQYVSYTNKRILQLIDSILDNSSSPPVIVITGDHGFRQFPGTVPASYYYDNFQAILLPGRNYSGFYNGISLVNLFRVILNTEFKQQLPMLADSTVTITNKYSQ